MRILEVVSPPSIIAITQEFDENYQIFAKASPNVVPATCLRFSNAKLAGTPVAGNDKALTGGPLTGFNRFHVITGKCIIVYKRVSDALRMYDMVTHKDYEGKNVIRLSNFLRSRTDSNFIEIDPDVYFSSEKHTEEKLDQAIKNQIVELIYEMVGEKAFFILKPIFVKNDWSDFFEWIIENIPAITPAAVFDAFGGQQNLKNIILSTIHQYGLDNEFGSI